MAKKKTSQKQKQKQTQKVVVNINQTAPKRRRARRPRRVVEQVLFREFPKVIYSDTNPITIYENQNRYKNIDAKPVVKSNTLVQLEDVGQVGTEGPVEILPRTSREQTADVDFVNLVPEAEKLPLNRRQGDNTEMRLPTNAASDLMRGELPSNTAKKIPEIVLSNMYEKYGPKLESEAKKREDARRRRNELARARYAKKKAKQGQE